MAKKMTKAARQTRNRNIKTELRKGKGTLHKAAGVPMGQTIPMGQLQVLAKSGGKVGARARWVLNLRRSLRGWRKRQKAR